MLPTGLLGKAYYELAQIKLKRHRNLIKQARSQNLLTHAALDTLREKERIARRNATDLGNLRKVVVALRVTFNHQRCLMIKRHFQVCARSHCIFVRTISNPDYKRWDFCHGFKADLVSSKLKLTV